MATTTAQKNTSAAEATLKRLLAAQASVKKSGKVKLVTVDTENPEEPPSFSDKPRVLSGAHNIWSDKTQADNDNGKPKNTAQYSVALGLWGYPSDFKSLFKRPELSSAKGVLEGTLISKAAYENNTNVNTSVSLALVKNKIVAEVTQTRGAKDYMDAVIKESKVTINIGYEFFAKARLASVNIVPTLTRKGKAEVDAPKKTRPNVTNVVEEIRRRFASGKRSDISRLEMKTRQKGGETIVSFIGMKPLPMPSPGSTSRPISTIPLGDDYPGVVISTSTSEEGVDGTKREGVVNGVAILLASMKLKGDAVLTEAAVKAHRSAAEKLVKSVVAAFLAEKEAHKKSKESKAKGGKKGKAGKKASAAGKKGKKAPKVPKVPEPEEEEVEVEEEEEVEVEEASPEEVEEVEVEEVKTQVKAPPSPRTLKERSAALKRNATPRADEDESESEESGSDDEPSPPPTKKPALKKAPAASPPTTSPSPTNGSPKSPQPVMGMNPGRAAALKAATAGKGKKATL